MALAFRRGEEVKLTRFASGVPLTSVFAGAMAEDGPQLAEAVTGDSGRGAQAVDPGLVVCLAGGVRR